MRPKLTIAVPTYNRKDKLKICLQSILEQANDKIEIIVLDNASTDGTEEVVNSFSNFNILYYRNAENLGPDRNFLKCYEKAQGEYVLLLGDDDILLPGAAEIILKDLEKEPVFLHLNSCGIINNRHNGEYSYTASRFSDKIETTYTNKDEYLKLIGIFITFVSVLVCKTDYIKEIVNKEQFIGSCFIQSHLSLLTMRHEGLYMIEPKVCVAASGNDIVKYDLYYVWVEQFKRLIIDTGLKSGFCQKTLEEIYYHELQKTVLNFVIQFRRSCKDEKTWDQSYIWNNIADNKRLTKYFKRAVKCPKKCLLLLKIYFRLFGIC